MDALQIVAVILTCGLFAYLTVAMLFPKRFS